MKVETINVTKDYVRQLINSDEFKKEVIDEAYEDEFKEECVSVEEKDYLIIYKYVVYGEVCFKLTFYCIDK